MNCHHIYTITMAFRKKVDFLQKERDELPQVRPVVIYVVAPVYSHDYNMRGAKHKLFETNASMPAGVSHQEGNPYNFCLIEANPISSEFDTQLAAALDTYKEASHKVVVINAHATTEGIIIQDQDEEKEIVTGRHFGEVISTHTHGNNIHVLVFAPYGHLFASSFYKFVQDGTQKEVQSVLAITSFTTEKSPLVWDTVATSGNAHIEVKRDIRQFVRNTVEPNTPYKILDGQLVKVQCSLL